MQDPLKIKEKFTLHPELQRKLEEYRTKRNFEPGPWLQRKMVVFNDFLRQNNISGGVISVSGGIDSAVTLAFIKKATALENSPLKKLIAVAQPIKSSDWALSRAKEVAEATNTELITVDQSDYHTLLQNRIDNAVGIKGSVFSAGQLRSYMRTPVGYYISQLLTQSGTPALVMGTGNLDEYFSLGFFCKAGDGLVDVQVMTDLHKSEVYKLGRYLNVPESILGSSPSADLWEGHTDEGELGFNYDFVELFTGVYLPLSQEDKEEFEKSLSPEALEQFTSTKAALEEVHNRNKHKLKGPVNLDIKFDI